MTRIAFVLLFAVPLSAAAPSTDVYGEDARIARTPGSNATAIFTTATPQRDRRLADRRADLQRRNAQSNDEWCDEARRNNDNDREVFCEVREFTIGSGRVEAETSNGSISVTGERRGDIAVRAMVVAHARTEQAARELGRQINVTTSGLIKATGPRTQNREGWSVSFRIRTPESTNVDLNSSNGSLSVVDVRGRIQLRTSNGSINLMDIGGEVEADTSNGSVNASLSGTKWEGTGLDISTSNGSVRLEVPDNYNARLVAGTSNGGISVGFPVMVQGRINRDIDTTLGSGGATIRVRTSNGSVSLQKR